MDLGEIVEWLKMWAPTIWYVTGFIAFWFGSGALVFRTVMRAFHSSGKQRVTGENPNARGMHRVSGEPGADQTVWVFSQVWVLAVAAMLGPFAFLFAAIYFYGFGLTRSIRRWLQRRRKA